MKYAKEFGYAGIRSGVTQCTLFVVLYLRSMCQCGLHTVLWSYIGILNNMCIFDAEPYSTAGPLFTSRCSNGTILLTLCSMVITTIHVRPFFNDLNFMTLFDFLLWSICWNLCNLALVICLLI